MPESVGALMILGIQCLCELTICRLISLGLRDMHGDVAMHLYSFKQSFDVWLIDHKQSCPLSYTETSECEKLAKNLGLIDMSRNRNNPKHICQESIAGKYAAAAKNAQKHMNERHV